MQNINRAREIKNDKSLDILVRYAEGGVMSKRNWLQMQLNRGSYVTTREMAKYVWDRVKYNRMSNQAEQEEYERKMNERKIAYILMHPENENLFWEITKTEFDYFNKLKEQQAPKAEFATEQEMKHLFGIN